MLAHCQQVWEAQTAYTEAAALDPIFLWPDNNLAWLLCTTSVTEFRNGERAGRLAVEICEKSNWSCWAFLGTLAAAHAATGEFGNAVAWQRKSLGCTPHSHAKYSADILQRFKAGIALFDPDIPPAAGQDPEEIVSHARLLDGAWSFPTRH